MRGYYTFNRYQDRQGKWRWTLYASNGKKIACSGEGYSRRVDCTRIARKLFPWLSMGEGA